MNICMLVHNFKVFFFYKGGDYGDSMCLLLWTGPTSWLFSYMASVAGIVSVDWQHVDRPCNC